MSDPYAEVIIQGDNKKDRREKECEKEKKTLNPKWNQNLEFPKVCIGDTMYLRVMDWDFDADDEIGSVDPIVLKGNDFEGWLRIKPSKEV